MPGPITSVGVKFGEVVAASALLNSCCFIPTNSDVVTWSSFPKCPTTLQMEKLAGTVNLIVIAHASFPQAKLLLVGSLQETLAIGKLTRRLQVTQVSFPQSFCPHVTLATHAPLSTFPAPHMHSLIHADLFIYLWASLFTLPDPCHTSPTPLVSLVQVTHFCLD